MDKGIGSLKQQIREETGGAKRAQPNFGPRLERFQTPEMRLADIASRKGISPGKQRMDFVKKIAEERGRVISDIDAKLFGSGAIDIREALSRAIPMVDMDMVRAERNEMQQQQLGFAAGDEVDVAALPEGLKAMYESGPKGREGVENIAAKTDKFAEGDEVSRETN